MWYEEAQAAPRRSSSSGEMTLSERLLADLRSFTTTRSSRPEPQHADAEDDSIHNRPTARRARCFESDYFAATDLLKERMNKRYPDAYHARLSARDDRPYDYGAKRADAVDTASTAIAMALREGATVKDAAEIGAASVGI